MRLQPCLQAGGLPVRQQVDHVPGAHIHQHRPVNLALGQREIVDPSTSGAAVTSGIGAAATSRSTVAGCTAIPRVPASRAAARPASSSPNPASIPSSGTLRRRYRAETPAACSAKVTAILDKIDMKKVKEDNDALSTVKNGPRLWTVDHIGAKFGTERDFQGLKARWVMWFPIPDAIREGKDLSYSIMTLIGTPA